jgi:hypothetical protein
VRLTVYDFGSGAPDDVDILLVGPEGDQVMLMSDACGASQPINDDIWTFDDDAAAALPDDGPARPTRLPRSSPRTNSANAPEPEQFGAGAGIGPPCPDALATFAGTDPNGAWDLYLFDDGEAVVGFVLDGWMLSLDVEPPPAPTPPPTPPPVAGPPPTIVQPAAPVPAQAAPAARTGRRAAAQARCKAKKTKRARKRCRVRARKLPR